MRFDLISEAELLQLHEATMEVLKSIGISTTCAKFRALLLDYGCREQNGRIIFTQDVIDNAMKTVPARWAITGRTGRHVLDLGRNNAYAQACVGPPNILDLNTRLRRDVTLKDLQDFTRLIDALDHINIASPIFPRDVPQESIVTLETATLFRNTSKPIRLCLESHDEWPYIYDLLVAVAGSKEALREKGLGYFEVSPMSPLDYGQGPAEALMDIVEAGIPLGIDPAPTMGATSPITIAGTVAQHAAEILAGVMASQMLRPGSRVVMSPRAGASMDMRSGVALWAAPEMGLGGALAVQLGRYYNIPRGAGCFTGASKSPDAQSGFEHLYNALLPALIGFDIGGSAGSVDNVLIASYEMLVIDDEISSIVQRTVRGVQIDADKLAIPVIAEVIRSGGNFLEQKHTRKQLRAGELWAPGISQRQPYDDWASTGRRTDDVARDVARKLLAEHVVEPLAPEVDAELDKIVKVAQSTMGK